MKPNKEEQKIIELMGETPKKEDLSEIWNFTNITDLNQVVIWLENGKEQKDEDGKIIHEKTNWSKLGNKYENFKSSMITLICLIIKEKELSEKLKEKEEDKIQKKLTELQTKYDMEVKTKSEVVKELQKEKGWWDKWIENEGDKKRVDYRLNSDYPSWTSIDGSKMKPILYKYFKEAGREKIKYSVKVGSGLDDMLEEGELPLKVVRKVIKAFYEYYCDR